MIFHARRMTAAFFKGATASLLLAALSFVAVPNALASELIVSFVAEITPSSYNGPSEIDPFNPTSQLGAGVNFNPDLIKADGQFIVKNFDPNFTGIYNFSPGGNSDAGVEFFLHTPLLERVEALTTRLGTGNAAGANVNTKILLPRTDLSTTTDNLNTTTTGFFGTGSLTVVSGVPTSFSYSMGQPALDSFNEYLFAPSSMDSFEIAGAQFSSVVTYDLDTAGAADNAPYGFNSVLNGNPGGTILDTTRGAVQAEIDLGSILDKKQSSGGMPIGFDPFDGTGTLYSYNMTSGLISITASTVPEPTSAVLVTLASLVALAARRRS